MTVDSPMDKQNQIAHRLNVLEQRAAAYAQTQKEQKERVRKEAEGLTNSEYGIFRDLLTKGVGWQEALTFAKGYATDEPSQEEVDAAIESIRRASR